MLNKRLTPGGLYGVTRTVTFHRYDRVTKIVDPIKTITIKAITKPSLFYIGKEVDYYIFWNPILEKDGVCFALQACELVVLCASVFPGYEKFEFILNPECFFTKENLIGTIGGKSFRWTVLALIEIHLESAKAY